MEEIPVVMESSVVEGRVKGSSVVKAYAGTTLVTTIEAVYEIAKEIFDDSLLHTASNRLYIRWPEINITNTEGDKHTIKDLIVRITMVPNSDSRTVGILFDGMRTSLYPSEMMSNYAHSHLPQSNDAGRFRSFCLGSSDFALMRANLQTNPTQENWQLFLMSIGSFLSWESLEGTPHIKMRGIGTGNRVTIPNNVITREAERLIPGIPSECFEGSSMIGGETLKAYIHANSNVRSNVSEGITPESVEYCRNTITARGTGIIWKDGIIPFTLLEETIATPARESTGVSDSVMNSMIIHVNMLLQQFHHNYKHEERKRTSPRAYFTLGQTKADNIRNTPATHRPTTHYVSRT